MYASYTQFPEIFNSSQRELCINGHHIKAFVLMCMLSPGAESVTHALAKGAKWIIAI